LRDSGERAERLEGDIARDGGSARHQARHNWKDVVAVLKPQLSAVARKPS
jgi:RNA polymerase subunit RPABC4/transcription elongation factor Spt4